MMGDNPAATARGMTLAGELREAARLLRKRAEAATPGPWERPRDTRYKNFVGAARPEDDEHPWTYSDGIVPEWMAQYPGYQNRYAGQRERVEIVSCPTWSDGHFSRKRSGRDLEYIASMHPLVGAALADWLEITATDYERGEVTGLDEAIKVARLILGTGSDG